MYFGRKKMLFNRSRFKIFNVINLLLTTLKILLNILRAKYMDCFTSLILMFDIFYNTQIGFLHVYRI
jgi:hypothetical protein